MRDNRVKIIENIFKKTIASNQIHECVLFVEDTSGNFSYRNGYGGRDLNSPLLMASITKLFTTTCILVLQERGYLFLNDKVSDYFDDDIMSGLHIYDGNEYSYELTISDLLFQISGLPDKFEEGNDSVSSLSSSKDSYIDFKEYVDWVKSLKPHFVPRTEHKAFYANINFDMLGEIIEKVTNLPLEQAYKQMIFEPLGMINTYLPTSEEDFIPNIYYKDKSIHLPKTIISSRASGGCITTAHELMIFIKAFFGGKLFSKSTFDKLSIYNKLQASKGPIFYGGGYMKIPLDRLTTLFMGKGELIGHSGSTGSFAFYYPLKDLFIIGDVNQMANPALPIRLIIKLAMIIK